MCLSPGLCSEGRRPCGCAGVVSGTRKTLTGGHPAPSTGWGHGPCPHTSSAATVAPCGQGDSPGSSSPPEGLPATQQFSDQTHTAGRLRKGEARAATRRHPSTQAEMGFQPACERVPEGAVQGGAARLLLAIAIHKRNTAPSTPQSLRTTPTCKHVATHTHTHVRAHTHTHTIQTVNVEKINGCAKNRTEPASSPNLRNAK